VPNFHPRLSSLENVGVNSFAVSHRDIPGGTDACTLVRTSYADGFDANKYADLSYVTGNENPQRT